MMKQRKGLMTQIVRAKENLNWAAVGPATDKHQAPRYVAYKELVVQS